MSEKNELPSNVIKLFPEEDIVYEFNFDVVINIRRTTSKTERDKGCYQITVEGQSARPFTDLDELQSSIMLHLDGKSSALMDELKDVLQEQEDKQ